MSLDAPKSDAELLAMLEQRTGIRGRFTFTPIVAPAPIEGAYVRIPWSHLISDNAKLRAALDKKGRPTVVLTADYREAKKRIGKLCAEAMDGRPPLTVPLYLVAEVWVPNNHRRDVVNCAKALHDAMAGTIFEDDSQLHDVRWIRAGVDVDAPRCELTITPLTPCANTAS